MTIHHRRVLTYLAALVVFGGLFRMLTDDRKVATQLPEPEVAASEWATNSLQGLAKPNSLAEAVKRAQSPSRVIALQSSRDRHRH